MKKETNNNIEDTEYVAQELNHILTYTIPQATHLTYT